ncbi:hypothetical protein MNBD_UNCLBAC01-1511 [hydrothermal vent metagenome]|uniref:Uncharacterized protein n=1 Tax=hydrothermal vent metagenome TaxID=652676 RepID=A0A3B1DLZ8_9ZZZZ
MSIIDQALRKTQSELEKKNNESRKPAINVETTPRQQPPPIAKPRPKIKKDSPEKKKVLKGLIFTFMLLAIFSGIYFIVKKTDLQTSSFNKEEKKKKNLIKFIQPKTTPLPIRAYTKGSFILNGTMIIGDNRVALINNTIYKIGENVNGKKIISISMREVILKDKNGERVSLRAER